MWLCVGKSLRKYSSWELVSWMVERKNSTVLPICRANVAESKRFTYPQFHVPAGFLKETVEFENWH